MASVHVPIKPKIDMIIERMFKSLRFPENSVGIMPYSVKLSDTIKAKTTKIFSLALNRFQARLKEFLSESCFFKKC